MVNYISELESLFEPDPRKRLWFELPPGHEAMQDPVKFLHSMADDAYARASDIRSRGNSPAARQKARLLAKCELLRQVANDGQFHFGTPKGSGWTELFLWKNPSPSISASISNPTLSTEGSGNSD